MSRRALTRDLPRGWPSLTRRTLNAYGFALQQVGRGNRNVLAVQYSQGAAHTKAPTCADVLDSLANDARLARDSFADFCANIGADEDSRKAEASYRECVDLMGRLAAFLGSQALFRELLDDVEGL